METRRVNHERLLAGFTFYVKNRQEGRVFAKFRGEWAHPQEFAMEASIWKPVPGQICHAGIEFHLGGISTPVVIVTPCTDQAAVSAASESIGGLTKELTLWAHLVYPDWFRAEFAKYESSIEV